MSLFCCNNESNCSCVSVVASIIIGIITAVLTFTATITVTPAFLWVLLGIAVVYLAITFVVSVFTNNSGHYCICSVLGALLTGLLGTILTSIVLLGVTFAAGSILGAIISGLLLTFFSLIITTTACIISCAANCSNCN